MAHADDDLSDELLALAGDADDRPRKKRTASGSGGRASASKRRKQEALDSDEEAPESEEDDSDPYPLEGKYKDEAERQSLLELPELEREEILAGRLEERQKLQDKANVTKLLRSQGSSSKDAEVPESRHKAKKKGLKDLVEKRKAKQDRKNKRGMMDDGELSPYKRRSSTSDDSSSEEGQVTKYDENEATAAAHKKESELTREDLERVRLTRDMLVKHCHSPFFEEYVKNAWVRYLIGEDNGTAVYRICEIISLGEGPKAYQINGQTVKQTIELKHGKSEKHFPMDKVSNSPFDPREFNRLVKVHEEDKIKMPAKSKIEKKTQQLQSLASKRLTESDVNAMLALRLKAARQSGPTQSEVLLTKSRLTQARNLAAKRHDYVEVKERDAQLATLQEDNAEIFAKLKEKEAEVDRFAKVNEMNRKANAAAVKKGEEIEREKRKAARIAAVNGGGGAPGSGASTPVPPRDLSARVKTMPRVRHEMNNNSRSSTPILTQAATEVLLMESSTSSTPLKSNVANSIALSVDIDLDF